MTRLLRFIPRLSACRLRLTQAQRQVLCAQGTGALVATATLAGLLHGWQRAGEPALPSLSAARFTVAVLAGPKQAAQTAPENATKREEAVITTSRADPNQLVTAERETSLPAAVEAAQDSSVGDETVRQEEVIPPARVSMPGGRLVVEDVGLGDLPDPLAIGARQVYLRIYVDADGKVVRGGIVRPGTEPLRDALILKAMMSRTYATSKLLQVPGGEPLWQLDLVLDYGSSEFLP